MKRFIYFLIAALFTAFNTYAQVNPNSVYVSGYTTSNGTYVAPYYRTTPNSTVNDNYSTVGNTNPYTGQAGNLPRDGYTPVYNSLPEYTPPIDRTSLLPLINSRYERETNETEELLKKINEPKYEYSEAYLNYLSKKENNSELESFKDDRIPMVSYSPALPVQKPINSFTPKPKVKNSTNEKFAGENILIAVIGIFSTFIFLINLKTK